MSTSTWVPLVTAAAGLVAGLAAGLVSTVLARRWASQDRAAAWQREDRLRWHADRLQVYARMIAVLQAWDAALQRILERRKDAESAGGSPPSFDAAEWDRHSQAVLELIAQLRLMAPEQVTNRALRCYRMFGVVRLQLRGAEDADLSRLLAAESEAAEATRSVIGRAAGVRIPAGRVPRSRCRPEVAGLSERARLDPAQPTGELHLVPRRAAVEGVHDVLGRPLGIQPVGLIDRPADRGEPKTRAGERRVYLDAATAELLREHRRVQLAARLRAGTDWQDHDLMFARFDGTPWRPSYVSRRFAALAEAAGVPLIKLHEARHSAISLMRDAGVDRDVRMREVGHADIEVADRYTHILDAAHRSAAEQVATLVAEAGIRP